MTYTVPFTDSTNPAKTPLVVQDGALNAQTNLQFPGKNYAGYGSIIATNFIKLLENFARKDAPGSLVGEGLPVQGQLWFDTSPGNNILRVYDGTVWNEAGNLKKAPYAQAPDPAASTEGDLWVDTTNSQLYLFSGSQWLLIGPQFSSGLQTGPIIEKIVDTQNITHAVISMFVAGTDAVSYRVAIISKDAFTPKASLDGYTEIKAGINLYSNSLTADSALLWGTAKNSSNLIYKGTSVSGSNFVRSDISSTINAALNIQDQGGLTIGTDLAFNISQGENSTVLYSNSSTKNIDFNLNGTIVVHIMPNGRVGIGTFNPTSVLDIAGTVTSTGLLVNKTTGGITTELFKVDGTMLTTTSKLPTTFGDDVIVNGQLTVNWVDNTNTPIAGPALLPGIADTYDIGSSTLSFRNIYAQSFVGSFNGSFTGNVVGSVSGSADNLKTATVFLVAGDVQTSDLGVSFTGQSQTGTAILNTTLSSTAISGKTLAQFSQDTDRFLVLQSTTAGQQLVNMDKRTFLTGTASYATPVGVIAPYAGLSTNIPPGYLLCDGSEISRTTFTLLFTKIGYNFKPKDQLLSDKDAYFALPDLRGSFPLGRDNMNNYADVSNFTQAKDTSGTSVPTGGQLGPANRVTDVVAKDLGGRSGVQNTTIQPGQLPQHWHSLNDGVAQYYAPGVNGGITDTSAKAAAAKGLPATASTGYGITSTHGVIDPQTGATTVGQSFNLMNPYVAINYIIFTGVYL